MTIFKKDPLQIIPYRTYGTEEHLYLKGRALEDEDINLNDKGWFKLLINSWKQFETDEIRNAQLRIRLSDGRQLEVSTDNEGYYLVDDMVLNVKSLLDQDGWLNYSVSFNQIIKRHPIQLNNTFMGSMLVPKETAKYGVISDIDDTILHTGVTSRLKWRVIVNTFLKTPQKRRALEGSSDFYKSLHQGCDLNQVNPIFYVSNSPWNLYRYLAYFLKVNSFPNGPLLLRDFRTPFDRTPKNELAHKYKEIYNILKSYPSLSFILIGDCGEKDPYIYYDIVKEFPSQIAAIYLRSVTHSRKMKRITNRFKDFSAVPFLIVEDTIDAINHAKTEGFIS